MAAPRKRAPDDDLRAALSDCIHRALKTLRRKSALTDDAIHTVRKDLKQARACLRLLRDTIGKPAFERANSALRDAARPLSSLRDAKVIVETLGEVSGDGVSRAEAQTLREMRGVMRREHIAVRRALARNDAAIRDVEKRLEAVDRHSRAWPPAKRTGAPVGTAARHIYRKGRKAFDRVTKNASDENLHTLRKEAKALAHALGILDVAANPPLRKLSSRADEIAKQLGDDHDLVVLQDKMRALTLRDAKGEAGLRAGIERKRTQRQAKGLKQADQVYRRKPRKFSELLDKAISPAPAQASARKKTH